LYGSTPIEDIPNYNVIVRALTEWTTSDQLGPDQTSITDGIGGINPGTSGAVFTDGSAVAFGTGVGIFNMCNVRQKYIQGIDTRGTAVDVGTPSGFGSVPNGPTANTQVATFKGIIGVNPVRRYQVQLALGMLTQEKLIPTKFMASQLAIEITLAQPADCMYLNVNGTTGSTTAPTYTVSSMNLIPEILEFDASYDESFLKGLQDGGVPIKFSTWNNYRFSNGLSSTANLQIQERSRSVKAIFAMQRRENGDLTKDNGSFFFNTDDTATTAGTTLQDFQFRIGGRYFPASPVQNSSGVGTNIPNGGVESYVELGKALNILGQPLSTGTTAVRWALNPMAANFLAATAGSTFAENDWDQALLGYKATGTPVFKTLSLAASSASGDIGSACFGMATDLETSNGLEISGLNAEEQSDISLLIRYSAAQKTGFSYEVFTYIDSMIVLRENNVIELLILGLGIDPVNCMILIKMAELNNTFEYIELCLDSWDASAAGGSAFENSTSPVNQIKFSWPQFYFTQKNLVVAGMKIIAAEIPFVFDTVTPGNNTFIFTVNGVQSTITIPVGTYTGTTLATQLQTLLAAVSGGFLVTWSSTTLRFTFTFAGGAVVWGFIFNSRATAYSLLGFLPSSTNTQTGNGSFSSSTVASPTGPYYLYVNSRSLGSLINFNLPDGAAPGIGPELCRIPVSANFGELILYTDPDPEKYFDFFIGHQFNTFDFYLTLGSDQYQKPLDMKGAPWSLKLGLLVYRDASQNLGKRPAHMLKGTTTMIE